MANAKDLRIQYHLETGKEPVIGDNGSILGELFFDDQDEIQDYIDWLEEKLSKSITLKGWE